MKIAITITMKSSRRILIAIFVLILIGYAGRSMKITIRITTTS